MGGVASVPYSIPNQHGEYVYNDPGIPIGFWRSPGGSVSSFVTESFFDEIAAAAGKDPYEYRRNLLDKAPRIRGVLELAAEKAGWGKPLPGARSETAYPKGAHEYTEALRVAQISGHDATSEP